MGYEVGDKIVMKKNYTSLPNDNRIGYFGTKYGGQVATIERMFPKRANGYQGFEARFKDNHVWSIDPLWCYPLANTPEQLELLLIKGAIDYNTYKELSARE